MLLLPDFKAVEEVEHNMLSFLWSGAWRIPVKISPEALAVSGLSHGHTLIACSRLWCLSLAVKVLIGYTCNSMSGQRCMCWDSQSSFLLSPHTELTSAAETETGWCRLTAAQQKAQVSSNSERLLQLYGRIQTVPFPDPVFPQNFLLYVSIMSVRLIITWTSSYSQQQPGRKTQISWRTYKHTLPYAHSSIKKVHYKTLKVHVWAECTGHAQLEKHVCTCSGEDEICFMHIC